MEKCMLDEALKNVGIIGAAGKMGSGIALLLLQEMARLEAEKTGHVGKGDYCLHLIDINRQSLVELRKYLRSQILKYAEKNINQLRKYFIKNDALVSNREIVDVFVDGAIDIIHLDTHWEDVKDCSIIFEVIVEDMDKKVQLFEFLQKICHKAVLYLTNTSSIPISYLNEKAQLDDKIIGFHFYNPPAVQKLIEFVSLDDTDPSLKALALELTVRLNKKAVQVNDRAGFIGNGFLMREIAFADELVSELRKNLTQPEAIYFVNKVTQDYLLRPMGIFQLMDYIGLDVCQKIANIIETFMPDIRLRTLLIDEMLEEGLVGGHNPAGYQKDGFFHYEGTDIYSVYSLSEHKYIPIDNEWLGQFERKVGDFALEDISWKSLQYDHAKNDKLKNHFHTLFKADYLGAELARRYLSKCHEFAQELVEMGVATKMSDIDMVLEYGFYHLYGMNYPWLIHELEGVNQ